MKDLRDFFLFCSGSNAAVLKKTPTEINKHTGIGATIFFTGLFAALAGAYAVFTIFQSYILAAIIGLVWGLMIFNLDRYIVSTLKMKRNIFRNFAGAFPRLILAFIIAIVIAKPMELKIFDTEIQAEIALMQQENIMEQETLLKSRFENDLAIANTELASLKQEITNQELKRDALDALAIGEADGTGGSQLRNMGPIYRAKKQDALKAQSELTQMKDLLSPQIEAKQAQVAALNDKMFTELNALNTIELSGFAARLEALDRLSKKSEAIFFANIFIMLLFIAIETTPIFVKLISSRSPYDYVLDKHEHAFAMNHQLQTTKLTNEIQNKLSLDTELNSYKTRLAIDVEKRMVKEAVAESYENLKRDKSHWKNIFKRNSLMDF